MFSLKKNVEWIILGVNSFICVFIVELFFFVNKNINKFLSRLGLLN